MDIYYKAIPCTGEKKELPKEEGWYWTLWGSSCEVSWFEPNIQAVPRLRNKWHDKEEDDVTSVVTHWLKKVEIPEMTDEQIEIYNGVGVIGTVQETFAWIEGAKWYKDWLKKQLTNK